MRSKKAIRGCRNSRSPTQSLEQKVTSHHLPQASTPLKSHIEPEWSAWWGIEWPSAWLWSVWNATFESSCHIHNTRHMRTCDLQAVSDKQRDHDQGSVNRTLICTWVLILCEWPRKCSVTWVQDQLCASTYFVSSLSSGTKGSMSVRASLCSTYLSGSCCIFYGEPH